MLPVTLLIQELISGISIGAIYALLALALVVIYRAAGVGNFAQSALATLSAFLAWDFGVHGIPVGFAFVLAVVASFAFGALVDVGLMRRLEHSSHLTAVICTFGLYIGLEGLIGVVWGYTPIRPASLFPTTSVGPADLDISWLVIGVLATTAVIGLLMFVLFAKTRIGLNMRAVVSNRESSRLVGIKVGRTLMFGWALACAVGGVAGMLAAPTLYLQPTMLDNVLLYAFAGAVLGGMTSYLGAVLGSLIVGILQAILGTYVSFIGGELSPLVALGIIWIVLLVRPQGLFGRELESLPW
jgi:branched-chain amino acid transport system permease protein